MSSAYLRSEQRLVEILAHATLTCNNSISISLPDGPTSLDQIKKHRHDVCRRMYTYMKHRYAFYFTALR